ncbi:translesion DNA synthesis-associated protein ImuA [Shewanella alkalitolerans]|uniref:translesion DNA synthesis-associated protein ImuA n=1 Tax=Shewanella alkalitolerans TaxID=2864209 RepID=UPI001C65E90A|nr:translesion DNA synthesis-associated protein ImuA [Shewanella alkalitolerans]QYJ96053.1 translesion DNA synthesis-associated protein ImuA [Shewanella alkalitolerans]
MALADLQLERLLQRSDLWRGDAYHPQQMGLDSGYPEFNRHLGQGGWPSQGLCEIFCSSEGIGELSLALPLMRRLIPRQSREGSAAGLVSLVAPPHVPYPQSLAMQGIDVSRLLWVDTQTPKEQLWALEQILTSGASPLVLCWLEDLSVSQARRLQLACEKGESLCLCYLPSKLKEQAHPVPLRIALQPSTEINTGTKIESSSEANTKMGNDRLLETQVDILKRRGGWPAPRFSLSLLPELLAQSLMLDVTKQQEQDKRLENELNKQLSGQILQGPWSA